MSNFKHNEIKGVIPALITPFDESENFDEGRTRKLVGFLLEQGVNGLYLTGSTGEGFLMSLDERKKCVEVVIDEVKGRVPVIVHIGAISTKLSIELAKHAENAGADAISSVPPFYWKFSENHIYNYYKDISDACSLPMIVYNVPLAGLMGFDFIKRLSTLENVKGIKYTASTHQDIYKCKELKEDFMVYSGADEMAVSGLFNEADGIIGSFYTMLPDLFIKLYNYVKDNKMQEAQRLQKMAVALIEASLKYDYYAVIKASTKWMGVDSGFVRRPFVALSEAEINAVKEEFRKIKAKYNEDDILVLKNL